MVFNNEEIPTLEFIYKNEAEEIKKDEEEIKGILSQGERRAIYILNIIFEIESQNRKRDLTKILIFDDIVDSFDYKNKYSILEYLKEYSENKCFNCIFLTHNYDFYRILGSSGNLNEEVMNLLLSSGANVNIVDDYGNSALHHSARRYGVKAQKICAKVVKKLIDSGVNISHKNKKNLTATQLFAQKSPFGGIEELLKVKSSDLTDGSEESKIAFEQIVKRGSQTLAKVESIIMSSEVGNNAINKNESKEIKTKRKGL